MEGAIHTYQVELVRTRTKQGYHISISIVIIIIIIFRIFSSYMCRLHNVMTPNPFCVVNDERAYCNVVWFRLLVGFTFAFSSKVIILALGRVCISEDQQQNKLQYLTWAGKLQRACFLLCLFAKFCLVNNVSPIWLWEPPIFILWITGEDVEAYG